MGAFGFRFPTMRSAQEILVDEGVSPAATAAYNSGQVQRGNTCRQPDAEPDAVLFTAADAL
jgi:hypothetical protein